MHFIFYFSKNC